MSEADGCRCHMASCSSASSYFYYKSCIRLLFFPVYATLTSSALVVAREVQKSYLKASLLNGVDQSSIGLRVEARL